MKAPSTVGIRAEWVCAHCGKEETTHELTYLNRGAAIPKDWKVRDLVTYCSNRCAAEMRAA